jgi:hypothetical protein
VNQSTHQKSDAVHCLPSVDEKLCSVIEGRMFVFIASGEKSNLIIPHVLKEIKRFFTFNDVPSAMYSIAFLSPNVTSFNDLESGSGKNYTTAKTNIKVNSQSIILYTIAGVFFLSSTGLAAWLRCTVQNKVNEQNISSLESQLTYCDSQSILSKVDTIDNQSHDSMDPSSPLNTMLPNAYRMRSGRNGMSVILESHEYSFNQDQSSSVFLSEGYSTGDSESDVDLSNLNYANNLSGSVLGALPR